MIKLKVILTALIFSGVANANWMSEEERQALYDRVQTHFLTSSEVSQIIPLNNLCRHRGVELGETDITSIRVSTDGENKNLVVSYSQTPGSTSFIHISDEVSPTRPSLRTLADFDKIVSDVNGGADLYVSCNGTGFVNGLFTELTDAFQVAYIGSSGLKWSPRFKEKYSFNDAIAKCEAVGGRLPTAGDVDKLLKESLFAQGYHRAVNESLDRDLLDLDHSADNFYTSTYTSSFYNYLSFAESRKTNDCFWQTDGYEANDGHFNCVSPYSASVGKVGSDIVNPDEARSVICVKE